MPGGREAQPRGRFWRELRDGWRAVRQNRMLLALAGWAFVGTIGGGTIAALLPVVAFRNLSGGPTGLGVVEAASVLGSAGVA